MLICTESFSHAVWPRVKVTVSLWYACMYLLARTTRRQVHAPHIHTNTNTHMQVSANIRALVESLQVVKQETVQAAASGAK